MFRRLRRRLGLAVFRWAFDRIVGHEVVPTEDQLEIRALLAHVSEDDFAKLCRYLLPRQKLVLTELLTWQDRLEVN